MGWTIYACNLLSEGHTLSVCLAIQCVTVWPLDIAIDIYVTFVSVDIITVIGIWVRPATRKGNDYRHFGSHALRG